MSSQERNNLLSFPFFSSCFLLLIKREKSKTQKNIKCKQLERSGKEQRPQKHAEMQKKEQNRSGSFRGQLGGFSSPLSSRKCQCSFHRAGSAQANPGGCVTGWKPASGERPGRREQRAGGSRRSKGPRISLCGGKLVQVGLFEGFKAPLEA